MKKVAQKLYVLFFSLFFPYLGQKIEKDYARVIVANKVMSSPIKTSGGWGNHFFGYSYPETFVTFRTGVGYTGTYTIEGHSTKYNEDSLYMISFKKHRNPNKKIISITAINLEHPGYAWQRQQVQQKDT